MVAARQNLGKHLSGMGLTEPVAAFARSVIAANNATNRNTDLMAYIDANSDKLDPVVVNALREFVSKFKVVMLDLYWCSGLYTLSITSQKISYNCCLMSMFAWNNQRLRKYLMGHSILSVVAFGATLFVGFMGTQPVHASWDIAVTRQREWSAGAIYIDTAIANLVLDALVLPIPYYFIWKLQMSRAGKWALNGLFGLQLVAFFIGVARTKMLGGLFGEDITCKCSRINNLLSIVLTHALDNAVPPLILTMSQLTVYIVCLCAPTLRWLWPPFKASIKKLCRNSPNVAPPVTLENVNYRAGHDSMRSNPYSQFDDCFIDDLPGNSAGVQSSVVSDIESTPSLNGPAALVENVV